MTITQHAHFYSFHASNFNFGEIFFLKFLSIQPLPSLPSPPLFVDCCVTARGLATVNSIIVVAADGIVDVPHNSQR
jgi:hypothetical protein